MPRPLRRIEAGSIYHVLNRGNGRGTVFRKPADFQAFVDILGDGVQRFAVDLLCWCVMGNHWHLVLRPRESGELQRFMQWITLTHVRRHHEHHASINGFAGGHLYQGRYKHFCVEADAYFLTLCRYVEANPLRTGLVKRARDWRWSSLHQRLVRGKTPALSDWPVDRPRGWAAVVEEAMGERELTRVRESVVRERPFGSQKWIERTARRTGMEQTLRSRGRPKRPIETLGERQRQRRERNGDVK